MLFFCVINVKYIQERKQFAREGKKKKSVRYFYNMWISLYKILNLYPNQG